MSKYKLNGINLLTEFFLMAIALSIVLGAIAYEGKQQLVAWVIGFPTIGFLFILIVAELAPGLLKFTRAFGVSADDAPAQNNDAQMAKSRHRVWLACWLFHQHFPTGFLLSHADISDRFLSYRIKIETISCIQRNASCTNSMFYSIQANS